jgi:hypothetical protein
VRKGGLVIVVFLDVLTDFLADFLADVLTRVLAVASCKKPVVKNRCASLLQVAARLKLTFKY